MIDAIVIVSGIIAAIALQLPVTHKARFSPASETATQQSE